ncbi:MAG: imidazole glycerol phosphate synthase subunit HisH [Phycisphaerae bacterium]|nr:imidazole glycerol phosphate synthase subunit HisH [Phycisphaerae bacterium]
MNTEIMESDSLRSVGIVDTGIANVESILMAFRRIGVEATRVRSALEITDVPGLVLPGVGRFGSGMAALERDGLVEAIRSRVSNGQATLAICLGLQLLAEGSDESPGVRGIGVIGSTIRRLPPGPVRPHLGWNRVEPDPVGGSTGVIDSGAAYFANGFALTEVPPGWRAAWTSDGGRFVAAIERGGIVACQFHPEISGSFGRDLLSRWVTLVGRETPCC